jgi:hypothetical protein
MSLGVWGLHYTLELYGYGGNRNDACMISFAYVGQIW